MTENNFTPPPELVREWNQEATGTHFEPYGYSEFIANRAAKWGADQELDACCEWLDDYLLAPKSGQLRDARRPKAPSLKEQALALLDPSNTYGSITREEEYRISVANAETIRRALEQLPE